LELVWGFTSLKANPKAFWRFVNSSKSHSSIPSTMSYGDVVAYTEADIANLFAAFFPRTWNLPMIGMIWKL